jgi:hypothetical protein
MNSLVFLNDMDINLKAILISYVLISEIYIEEKSNLFSNNSYVKIFLNIVKTSNPYIILTYT